MGNKQQVPSLGPVVSRKAIMSKSERHLARRLKIHWDHSDRTMHYPMIQWFIRYDNFGAVKYDHQFYNLTNTKDRYVLMVRLILDGVINVQGFIVHDDFGNEHYRPGYFRVLVDDYLFIHCKEERFFWINMVDRLLPQMSEEECEIYNTERNSEKANAI